MKTLMISAMESGAGKTVLTCALLMALKKRGLRLRAFKCGPDYIDPMFHTTVLGVESRNLDLFLQGEAGVRKTLSGADADFALLEGAMGYYDGLNNTSAASAWELARLTAAPTVLAVSPGGSGLTLAAQIRGLLDFRPRSGIQGIILTNCPERRAFSLAPALERETELPVLGFLPPMEEARFESRHLGLLTAGEIGDLSERMEKLGAAAEEHIDLEKLISLAEEMLPSPRGGAVRRADELLRTTSERHPLCARIAVARDEAFCFLYADNLDALRAAGAEPVFFSPLRDKALPPAEGLYLPGGYPELYARGLSENRSMRRAVSEALARGMPTVAECGGFLYLMEFLEDAEGRPYPMCAALPGRGFKTEGLRRFGYLRLRAAEDSLLFRTGERVPAHEFHHWDSTENGAALRAEKADGRAWSCGYAAPSLYAAFPHLHFGGETPFAQRFVKACEAWKASTT